MPHPSEIWEKKTFLEYSSHFDSEIWSTSSTEEKNKDKESKESHTFPHSLFSLNFLLLYHKKEKKPG